MPCLPNAHWQLGLSLHAHLAIYHSLTSQPIVFGLLLELAVLKVSAGRQIFTALDNFHNAGAALTVAPAIHHLSRKCVQIDAVF